ncbi:DUF4123 domain-containing protein [Serratia fonticola]|uniref:DUF4123 domain-containing protein n=2 Tax=Serratia fonticola TaxID=47917 RepID=UPI00217C7D01|nr:DUF4123 domain-containing protein [Serratia fonticola]CAI1583975.1 Uncharacterised protein [Serratia fonticola]CAI1697505.1 Uncharacterised protein [Serratia fonticola]CAI1738252.1 Uncharacterised protein [Serratia fonticola]
MESQLQQWLAHCASGQRLYAVLSSVSDAQPLKHYYQLDGSRVAEGIYHYTSYKDWHEVMPYLVELSVNSPFLAWVSEASSTDWGWLAVSEQPRQRILDHLRGLTQINLPDRKTVFFRYWDAQFLPLILEASTESQQNQLMGVFSSLWIRQQMIELPAQAAPILTGIVTLEEAQLAKLKQQNQSEQVSQLQRYFTDKYPKRTRLLGNVQVQRFITLIAEKCQTHRLERFNDRCQFLDLACSLGSHFDTDLQLEHIVAPYLTTAVEEPGQLAVLNQQLGLVFVRSMGERLELYLAALERLNILQLNQLPYMYEEQHVVNYVRSLYPERAQYVPIHQMFGLLAQNQNWFQEHGITTFHGQAVILALQFFLGHKVFDDPLYPWVKVHFADNPINQEDVRLAELVAYTQRRIRKELLMLRKHLEAR